MAVIKLSLQRIPAEFEAGFSMQRKGGPNLERGYLELQQACACLPPGAEREIERGRVDTTDTTDTEF